jgi:DNA-binding IclR family transcriptional regulator
VSRRHRARDAVFSGGTVVKSAVRTVDILSTLAHADGGMLHSEIADQAGIPPSSLTALLRDLLDLRYVDLDPHSKRYSLGPAVLALSSAYLKNLNLAKVAEPTLRELFRQVNEFTSLVVINGGEVTKVREYAVADPFAAHLQLGESGPLHATASGKAILAFSRQLAGKLAESQTLRVYTTHTLSDRGALESQLRAIRQTAIAYCREEYLDGMVSMAVPVFDATEEVVAAIGVNTRTVRFTSEFEQNTRVALLLAGRGLSSRLGSTKSLAIFGRARLLDERAHADQQAS